MGTPKPPSPAGGGAGGRDGEFAEHAPRPSSGSGLPAGTRPAREGTRLDKSTVAPSPGPSGHPLPAGEGKNGLGWLWLAGLALALDQLSKLAVLAKLVPYQDVIPLTGFFNLVHVHNTGAAFSLFADQPGWQRGFFLAVAVIASAVMLFLLRKTRGRPRFSAALALILGGAVGNLVDRVLYGHVIDFLDFYLGAWHWPAFNVADSAITLGAALLIWDSLGKAR